MITKAITLWNPWASFVSWEEKIYETKSWYTSYRGPLAIHASKAVPNWVKKLCCEHPFKTILASHGVAPNMQELAFGSVAAICNLVDCQLITENGLFQARRVPGGLNDMYHPESPLPKGNEFALGDYAPGRFAWRLSDIQLLKIPIPAKGRQGLWNWDAPEEVVNILNFT